MYIDLYKYFNIDHGDLDHVAAGRAGGTPERPK
jgi:hypothetical protein